MVKPGQVCDVLTAVTPQFTIPVGSTAIAGTEGSATMKGV
jgi:hypothetical protein